MSREQRKQSRKPKFPRQEYRKNWDMVHERADAYSRSKSKKEFEEQLEELDEENTIFFPDNLENSDT